MAAKKKPQSFRQKQAAAYKKQNAQYLAKKNQKASRQAAAGKTAKATKTRAKAQQRVKTANTYNNSILKGESSKVAFQRRARVARGGTANGIHNSFGNRTLIPSSKTKLKNGQVRYTSAAGNSITANAHSRQSRSVTRASVRGGYLGSVVGGAVSPAGSGAGAYLGAREARNKRIDKLALQAKSRAANHPTNRTGRPTANRTPSNGNHRGRKGHPVRGAGGKFNGWTS